jgi:hypothetical protein
MEKSRKLLSTLYVYYAFKKCDLQKIIIGKADNQKQKKQKKKWILKMMIHKRE